MLRSTNRATSPMSFGMIPDGTPVPPGLFLTRPAKIRTRPSLSSSSLYKGEPKIPHHVVQALAHAADAVYLAHHQGEDVGRGDAIASLQAAKVAAEEGFTADDASWPYLIIVQGAIDRAADEIALTTATSDMPETYHALALMGFRQ